LDAEAAVEDLQWNLKKANSNEEYLKAEAELAGGKRDQADADQWLRDAEAESEDAEAHLLEMQTQFDLDNEAQEAAGWDENFEYPDWSEWEEG